MHCATEDQMIHISYRVSKELADGFVIKMNKKCFVFFFKIVLTEIFA
jgi:hypothetical protein